MTHLIPQIPTEFVPHDHPAPPPGLELERQFASLLALEPGWLDGEGERIDPEAVAQLRAVLVVADGILPVAHVYPTPEGGAMAEWSPQPGCRYALSITTGPLREDEVADGVWIVGGVRIHWCSCSGPEHDGQHNQTGTDGLAGLFRWLAEVR
jgi:hypothetical protein